MHALHGAACRGTGRPVMPDDVITRALQRLARDKPLCNCRQALDKDCRGPEGHGCSYARIRGAEKIAQAMIERDDLLWEDAR